MAKLRDAIKADALTPPSPLERAGERSQSDNLKLVLQTQIKLREAVANEIKFSQPILEQAGNPVIFPHTINVFQGQAGVHKSRLAEIVCASLLKKHGCSHELLGFKRTNLDAIHTVVYVDTERNLREQLPYALQSIQIKAGYKREDVLQNFQYISLLQVPRKDRFNCLNEYLTYLRHTNTNPLFIVLDVSTDCIEDFNKTDKSMELIDLMNVAVNDHNAIFLCIIHENPNSEKARGHFGTELMNKASTVLQVGFEKDGQNKDTNLIRAKYMKCRSSARHTPFYFKYSTDDKGLVLASAADISSIANSKVQKAPVEEIKERLELYLGDGCKMERRELINHLKKDFDAVERTIEERLKTIIDQQSVLTNNAGMQCTLTKENIAKITCYYFVLQPF